MILEALQYAATHATTPRQFRPHIRYSVNLWARARRCAAAWAQHEENSRRFILAAAGKLKQRRTAVILGSGLLRDVPAGPLSAAFDTVVLVDLVHLASVRTTLALRRRRSRIILLNRDLSGYDDLAAGKTPEPLGFLRQVPYLDFVVSANLLSQIGVGARHRFENVPAGVLPNDTVARLVKAHLDGLASLACKACLITDTAFDVIDRNGITHQREDLLHGVAIDRLAGNWDWPVAPLGEESRDYRILHKVAAAEMT